MDERVRQAMERWPDVPAAYGWLRLDRRGRWYLIDRNTPNFNEAQHGQGSLLRNENLVDFIARNYRGDTSGSWYWQNGPQKAYADLDAAPLIVRVMNNIENSNAAAAGAKSNLITHTGLPVTTVSRVCIGLDDVLYLSTDLGPASIHDMDLGSLEIDEANNDTDANQQSRVLLLDTWHNIETLDQPAGIEFGFTRRPRIDQV